MSTPLENNTATMQAILEAVNNFPEAGGGSGGGASVERGQFTITDNGMYEPGVSEYALTSDSLQSSSRLTIVLYAIQGNDTRTIGIFDRSNTSESFVYRIGSTDMVSFGQNLELNENYIMAYGSIAVNASIYFIAI